MKRILMVFVAALMVVPVTFSGEDDLIEVTVPDPVHGDVVYVFGPNNGLTAVKDTGGNLLYDFGDRPCWFMLTYLHQEKLSSSDISEAEYYYPLLGNEMNFSMRSISWNSDGTVNKIEYYYKLEHLPGDDRNYLCSDNDCTWAILEFSFKYRDPLDGIAVFIRVQNEAPDSDAELRRLMDVHCPFVRLQPIGESQEDDYLTIGDFLLKNPIRNYGLKVEPWKENKTSGTWVFDDQYYSGGFPVWAYYGAGGTGFYMALYNVERKTCQTNIYKHESGMSYTQSGWDRYMGASDNWPAPDKRNYLLWDVVRYTEDVNQEANDYPNDRRFCAFIKFYKTGLDWYEAANRYRDTVMRIDENTPGSQELYSYFNNRDGSINLWPDYSVKESPLIPEWVKNLPLHVYVSPQSDSAQHTMFSGNLVFRRIREWQSELEGLLEIYPGYSNIMVSTWVNEWGSKPDRAEAMAFGVNGPELANGLVPIDAGQSDGEGEQNWREKFLRDGTCDFIKDLQDEPYHGSNVKFLATTGGYLNKYDTDETYQRPDEMTTEYLSNSWPLNTDKRPILALRFLGFDNEIASGILHPMWGQDRVNGYGRLDIPYKYDMAINTADILVMDYLVGSFWDGGNVDLPSGILDSMFGRKADGFLGATGTYVNFARFRPNYIGFNYLGCTLTPVMPYYYSEDGEYFLIPPGGGSNYQFRADKRLLRAIEEAPGIDGDPMVMNEGFSECFLDQYDLVYVNCWPGRGLTKTNRALSPKPVGARIGLNDDDTITEMNGRWVPFLQAVSHEYLIVEDGLDWFPSRQYWHGEIDSVEQRWSFYGANCDNELEAIEDQWLAYHADMAYSFAFGARMGMYDVDVGSDEKGNDFDFDHDPDNQQQHINYVIDFFHEGEYGAQNAVAYFKNMFEAYRMFGYPTTSDKVAEGLFFGKMLKAPGIATLNLPVQDLKYDLNAGLVYQSQPENTYKINILIKSPPVLNSFWKYSFEENGETYVRLMMVFTNYTENFYTVSTYPVDLTEYLPHGKDYYTYFFTRPGHLAAPPKLIGDPTSFRFSVPIGLTGYNVAAQGVYCSGIAPQKGDYARINDDPYLDLLKIDDDKDAVLKVIFGDGSMVYHEEDAVEVAAGVRDFDAILSEDGRRSDIVVLTASGLQIYDCEEDGTFNKLDEITGVFDTASEIKSVDLSREKRLYMVRDTEDLYAVRIDIRHEKESPETFDIEPVNCLPVRSFEVGYLNEDGIADIATIATDGTIEILTCTHEYPEHVISIEIGTDADGIEFIDEDMDSDVDINLTYQSGGTKGRETTLTNVGGWKFVP